MLIRFTVDNFKSFKERQRFSMIPGKGTLKPHHKSTSINGVSALKLAVIFGANASGKSNLIQAIDFGRETALKGTKAGHTINITTYRLDERSVKKPTYIEYEFQHREKTMHTDLP